VIAWVLARFGRQGRPSVAEKRHAAEGAAYEDLRARIADAQRELSEAVATGMPVAEIRARFFKLDRLYALGIAAAVAAERADALPPVATGSWPVELALLGAAKEQRMLAISDISGVHPATVRSRG
jgi:hypothetical protein